ncbi:MAG: hypothetical protein Q8O61_10565 [Nocardioides sp.]|nr:hypothetical protein [Nocardioides sp.]
MSGVLSSGWWLLGQLAALAAAAAFVLFAISRAGRNATRRVHYDGRSVVVRMRRTFIVAATVQAVTLTAFFGLQGATNDDADLRLLAGGVCALCLVAVPDLLRATLTRTHLTFDATGIRVRCWTTEAGVALTDVQAVDLDLSISTRPALRITTRPPALSLSVRRRRILLPLEPRTPEGQIVVPAIAFDEPWLLCALLAWMVDLTPEERARQVSGDTVRFLTGVPSGAV